MTESKTHQRLLHLTVKHFLEANVMVGKIVRLRPCVTFRCPEQVGSISVNKFSDVSHGGNENLYGKTGFISGLRIEPRRSSPILFHTILRSSHKKLRVSYCSFGAKILSAATRDDRVYDMRSKFPFALSSWGPIKARSVGGF